MTELEALRTEIDELRYELQQRDEKIARLFAEAAEKHIRPLFDENRRDLTVLADMADKHDNALRHIARHMGSSPAAAGAYVLDTLLT